MLRLRVEVEGGGTRLDRWLTARFPELSRALIMKYLKEGKGRLNGTCARPGWQVKQGDLVELPDWEEAIQRIRGGRAEGFPPAVLGPPVQVAGLNVLYEDDELVAVDKPPGLVMHPGKGHEDEGLDRLLRIRFGPATRLVHRIDRDTSGVVVAARGHPNSARRLAEAFRQGDPDKVYLALVRGNPDPPEGRIEVKLRNTRRAGEAGRVDPSGKAAVTEYVTQEEFGGFAWMKIRIHTGRRHQIRVHFAHLGHPLAVDPIYGERRKLRLSDLRPELPLSWKNPVLLARQPLHAAEISLRHPRTGKELTFRAPLPADLSRVLEVLREISAGS